MMDSDLHDNDILAEALNKLASQLPESLQFEALEIAQAIEDDETRLLILQALEPCLSGDLHTKALRFLSQQTERREPERSQEEVLLSAKQERWAPKKIKTLTSIARDLEEPLKAEALQEALQTATAVSDADAQVIAFTKLARQLPEALRVQALLEALRAALVVEQTSGNDDHLRDTLELLAPYLPDHLDTRHQYPTDIDERDWTQTLSALAPHLSKAFADNARQVAHWGIWGKGQHKEKRTKLLSEPMRIHIEDLQGNYGEFLLPADREWRLLLRDLFAHLPGKPGKEVFEAVQTAPGETRMRALRILMPLWPKNLQTEAVQVVREITDAEARAKALCRIAPSLSGEQQTVAVQEAWLATKSIPDDDPRAHVFLLLGPQLPESMHDEAFQVALAMREDTNHALAINALAPRLPKHLIADAWKATLEIHGEDERALALSTLASRLTDKALVDACSHVWTMRNHDARALAFCALAPFWPDKELTVSYYSVGDLISTSRYVDSLWSWWMDQKQKAHSITRDRTSNAWFAGLTIENLHWRALALSGLAHYLPDAFVTYAWSVALKVLWLDDAWALIAVLNALAPRLPDNLKSWAWREVLTEGRWETKEKNAPALIWLMAQMPNDLCSDVLSRTRSIKYESTRAIVLSALAGHCPEPLRDEVAQQALQACKATDHWDSRAEALRRLAPHLTDELMAEALETAKAIEVKEIQDEDARARALSALVPHLPDRLRIDAWKEAWQSALTVWRTVIGFEYEKRLILSALAPYVPDQLKSNVLEWVQTLADGQNRAVTIMALAPYLSEQLRIDSFRLSRMSELAPYLPNNQQLEILQEVSTIRDDYELAHALLRLIRIVPGLTDTFYVKVIEIGQRLAGSEERVWAEILGVVAAYGSPDLRTKILTIAQSIEHDEARAKLLCVVAPLLRDDLQKTTWEKALRAAQGIGNTDSYLETLFVIRPHLSPNKQAEAMAEAFLRVIQDEYEQSTPLRRLRRARHIEILVAEWKQTGFVGLGDGRKFWSKTLHTLARRHRGEFLLDLAALAPLIEHLGGEAALRETFFAVRDATQWWP